MSEMIAREEPKMVTLASIGGGAAMELFDVELGKVLANIADVNTEATAKRRITIDITFTPREDRAVADAEVKVASRLVGINSAKTLLYVGKSQGRHFAVESNPRQLVMDLAHPADIVAIQGKE
jgi:hypothetical protein